MKLSQRDEQYLSLELQYALVNTQITLLSIERNLQVLGSELCPYLHELNAEIDQLRKRIEEHRFND